MNAMINIETIKTFIMEGKKATFTIKSPKTGVHYTYTVTKPKGDAFADRFVNLHASGKNIPCMGYIKNNQYHTTKKYDPKQVNGNSTLIECVAFDFFWKLLMGNKLKVEFFNMGTCSCCGRPLTDPESIERGIGPNCYGKMTKSKAGRKDFISSNGPFGNQLDLFNYKIEGTN